MSDFSDVERRLRRTLPNARIVTTPIPQTGIHLGLINADFSTAPLAQATMNDVLAEPAYWSFCWGSGRGLAEYLASNPHIVTTNKVLDVGSGSGIAGIAAARLGASRVTAFDSDDDALAATRANATLNGVALDTANALGQLDEIYDIALLADVLYDAQNFELIEKIERVANKLIIADSRIRDLSAYGYAVIEQFESVTLPNLGEFDEFRTVNIFLKGPA